MAFPSKTETSEQCTEIRVESVKPVGRPKIHGGMWERTWKNLRLTVMISITGRNGDIML